MTGQIEVLVSVGAAQLGPDRLGIEPGAERCFRGRRIPRGFFRKVGDVGNEGT